MGLLSEIRKGVKSFFALGGIGFFMAQAEDSPYNLPELQKAYRRNVWVNACVRRIADVCAGIPINVVRRDKAKDGKPCHTPVDQGPVFDRIQRPHERYTMVDFKRNIISQFVLNGEAYIFGNDGTAGRGSTVGAVDNWRPLNPAHVSPVPDQFDYISAYRWRVGGQDRFIQPHFITSMLSFNPETDYRGLPPSQVAADPVLLRQYMVNYNQMFFKNGASGGLFITTDMNVKKEVIEQIRQRWRQTYEGVKRHHKTGFLTHGFKPTMIGQNARDGEFLGLGKMAREEVAAVYQVPPVLLGIFEFANYANSKEQISIFIDYTIIPILQMFEDKVNNQLIPTWYPEEAARGVFIEHDLSAIRAKLEDEVQNAQRDSALVSTGIMTINEVRADRNLPPVSWGNDPPPAIAFGVGGTLGLSANADDGSTKLTSVVTASLDFDQWKADKQDRPAPAPGLEFKGSHEERLTAVWKAFDRRAERDEVKHIKLMRKVFTDQEDRLIDNLFTVYQDNAARSARSSNGQPDWIRKVSPDDLFALFDLESETVATQAAVRPLMNQIIEQIGKLTMTTLGADGNLFNVHDPKTVAFIQSKVMKFGRDITPATKEIIRRILADAFQDDLTVSQTATKLKDRFARFRKIRTITIARTEIIGAHNGATILSYKQSGLVELKVWLTSRDDRVRETHEAMDGVAVGVEGDFPNGLQAPGVGGIVSPPSDIVNCRCTVVPKVIR